MIPKVSIILTTYNGGKYITQAIESVLLQTLSDFELIIINDASTDNTEKIISNLANKDSRIKYFKNKTRVGFRKCLNQGLRIARGKYIARIDDDDIWEPQKLEKQVNFLEKNPEYILIGSGAIFIDENGREIYRFLPPDKDEDIRRCILSRNPFIHSSVVFLKEIAMKFSGYDDKLPENEDFDLWLKVGTVGKFYNLPEYLVKFRTPSLKANIAKIRRARTKVFISIIRRHSKNYPNYKKAVLKNYLKLFYTYLPKPKFLEDYFYQKRQTSGWHI